MATDIRKSCGGSSFQMIFLLAACLGAGAFTLSSQRTLSFGCRSRILPCCRSEPNLAFRKLTRTITAHASAPKKCIDDDSSGSSSSEKSLDENWLQRFVRWMAELSLLDYKWRSDLFKSNEAERMLQNSLARLRGDNPNYVRPMDASGAKIGPLGQWEKNAVDWLSQVIDEEGRRAKQIVNEDGRLVRPKDARAVDLGPLGFLEKKVSDFFLSIRNAEMERARICVLRPKDMDASLRGPLGEAEFEAVRVLKEIEASETLRVQQSKIRGGEVVRPIDVPGPLGDFEMAVLEIFDAEQRRYKERERAAGHLVRPKDARLRGPLGEAEQTAYETIRKVSVEEQDRLESIKKVLQENRPMENYRGSFLGIAETIIVGIVRAPIVLASVVQRVVELLSSSALDEADKDVIEERLPSNQTPDSSPDERL
jgi:hypothetical protein